jgi:pimeloyl-ACP methyl ester carboxylesterase
MPTPAQPSWFTGAVADPGEPGVVDVAGVAVHIRRWSTTNTLVSIGTLAAYGWSLRALLFVRAEQGSLTPEAVAAMSERIRGPVDVVAIDQAGHHVMFDQSLALRDTLLERLDTWQ